MEKIERRGRSDRGQSRPHVPRDRTDGAGSQRHDVQRVQRECIIKKNTQESLKQSAYGLDMINGMNGYSGQDFAHRQYIKVESW